MQFQVLFAAVLVAGLGVLEVMTDKGSFKNEFGINSDLHSIKISDEDTVGRKFDQFKSTFERDYGTKEAGEIRQKLFQESLALIKEMKANLKSSATYGIKQSADKRGYELPLGLILLIWLNLKLK